MKTAKEIATEYLKEFDRYYLSEQVDELTKEIELYAQEQVKLCALPLVSQRSELLKAFYAYVDDKWAFGMLTDKVDEVIEGFEKSL